MRRAPVFLIALVVMSVALGLAGCGGGTRQVPAIRTSAGDLRPMVYVALGDSYTGAPRVGRRISVPCNRTDLNYPHLFAADRETSPSGEVNLIDVSCGGARIRDLTHRQKPVVARQLAAVRADADLVTVAVGGNDVGIMSLVGVCLTKPAACQRRRDTTVAGLKKMRTDLVAVLRRVKAKAPHATIVVIGYPEILPSTGRCLKAGRTTLTLARGALNRIAIAQRNAATQAGVGFLDPRSVTRGHGLCTKDPWIALRTTATSQQYHPTEAEQRAVATALEHRIGTQLAATRVGLPQPGHSSK
ncbi:SGNH/GDSL hydrolase family protein [Nocardioides sp.]|uniref:SGNH/GDSL hydrolase family protein n=1 Tax=Nocardioides sp. TaxID=35761 RepID=UPI00261623EA|nr:SGNH/GDSL hydrolase family protein [Nocardioides sp.]